MPTDANPTHPDPARATAEAAHLYLHVPYCAAKCPYCDFNSVAGREDEHAAYVAALLTEIRRLPAGPYRTVFIGGGTPTMLGPALLARLLAGLRQHIRLADDAEFTCEANPGSADAAAFAVLADHGVNRISLGVQSTHDHHLRFLGRVHDAAQAEAAIALARRRFARVSADLIFGLPGQTPEEIDADLELYRRHDLAHASLYHLAIEPGTEFHARRARGELAEIHPGQSHALFARVADGLGALGLVAYETSNFSRPGEESRHNLAYWHQHDYAAAGAGAVSTLAGIRLTREKHSGRYIDAITAGGDAAWKRESLTPDDRLAEAWMLGLRLAAGVPRERLAALGDAESRWLPRAYLLAREGLLELGATHVRLTAQGRPVQDEITVHLMPD